jgi:alanine-synthesizing transaminase
MAEETKGAAAAPGGRSAHFSSRTAWNIAANRLSQVVARIKHAGGSLLDLSESNPTRCEFEFDESAILAAFQNPGTLKYQPDPRGLEIARAAVTRYYADHSIPVAPDDLILTTSTSEAYSFLFRLLCDAGDEVLAPTPSYPLFEFLAGLDDVALRSYELVYHDGWQIDFASLSAAMTDRTRAVMLVNPNNPTGSFVKRHEAEQLNGFCVARRLALIADEVFLDYAVPSRSADEFSFVANPHVLTFTLSGLSKIAAMPQMKAAWIVVSGPEEPRRAALERLEVIADTFLSMSTPVQLAMPQLLEQRQTVLPQIRTRISQNLGELDRQLAGHNTRGLVERLHVEGGWYAVLRVPVTQSDEELAVALVEREQVLVHPGHFYDFHRDGYLVVSLITPEEAFREGIGRILRLISRF